MVTVVLTFFLPGFESDKIVYMYRSSGNLIFYKKNQYYCRWLSCLKHSLTESLITNIQLLYNDSEFASARPVFLFWKLKIYRQFCLLYFKWFDINLLLQFGKLSNPFKTIQMITRKIRNIRYIKWSYLQSKRFLPFSFCFLVVAVL